MKHANSLALYDYWNRIRGRRGVASRADVVPRDLGPLLTDLLLIDTDPGKEAAIRFCGASVAARYGRDLEGESFFGLWVGEDVVSIKRNLSILRRHDSGILIGVMAETAGDGFTAYELTLLPLRGPDFSDAAIVSMGRVGGHDEANRLRARIVSQEIRSLRFLEQQAAPPLALERRVTSALAVHPAPDSRNRPILTVVIGGKA